MSQFTVFENRRAAGRRLAAKLQKYTGAPDTLVVALPRGGVPVGFEIAKMLGLPLDILLVRKLGCPDNPELAMGAISECGARILNPDIASRYATSIIEETIAKEVTRLKSRGELYRPSRDLQVKDKTVLLVDDGAATGATIRVAIASLRQMDAKRIVVVLPVVPPETKAQLAVEADEVLAILTPTELAGVGRWYTDFSQTSDEEVIRLLRAGFMTE